MYLTFDEYTELGGATWSEDDYEDAEYLASLILDDVTLNRLQSVDWSDWEGRVKRCMFIILETLPALQDAFKSDTSGGGSITQFSNGVNQFSMSGSTSETDSEAIQAALYRQLVSMLPVELCSICAVYNDAG